MQDAAAAGAAPPRRPSRIASPSSGCGGTGRRARLRALWPSRAVEVRILSAALFPRIALASGRGPGRPRIRYDNMIYCLRAGRPRGCGGADELEESGDGGIGRAAADAPDRRAGRPAPSPVGNASRPTRSPTRSQGAQPPPGCRTWTGLWPPPPTRSSPGVSARRPRAARSSPRPPICCRSAPRRSPAIVTEETGGTFGLGHDQRPLASGMLREAGAQAYSVVGEVIPSDIPGATALARRKPTGAVVGIAPWNAPVILGTRAIATPRCSATP